MVFFQSLVHRTVKTVLNHSKNIHPQILNGCLLLPSQIFHDIAVKIIFLTWEVYPSKIFELILIVLIALGKFIFPQITRKVCTKNNVCERFMDISRSLSLYLNFILELFFYKPWVFYPYTRPKQIPWLKSLSLCSKKTIPWFGINIGLQIYR